MTQRLYPTCSTSTPSCPREKPGTRAPAIANVIIDQLRHGSYVAAQLVMQSGPLALIISGAAISVARRNLDGWHYVISRLDL